MKGFSRLVFRVLFLGMVVGSLLPTGTPAQTFTTEARETIFPGLWGQRLLDSLVAHYSPTKVRDYGEARDYMFTVVDNFNDSVTCVYTGYRIFLYHNSNTPRSDAYHRGINTEHTWPRSKGARYEGPLSDLHHLFPTRIDVNEDRSNYPFDEIPDHLTDTWYWKDIQLHSIPDANIDEYSELDLFSGMGRFEPREDHKGNVARAMFYFYTIYKKLADQEDPYFFQDQKHVLRRWNMMDPVDSLEIRRTRIIARFQGNVNPFVLDTTLIGRAYFGVTSQISRDAVELARQFVLEPNYPNPFNGETWFQLRVPTNQHITVAIFDLRGRQVKQFASRFYSPGEYLFRWDGKDDRGLPASSGIYFYVARSGTHAQIRKMVLLR
ncbi:MAG: T9SS type A sorting domain-containing protein [Calditrichaeota bacterium]|nr:T9SS type A sorting domain-containing protein [Calditrichota bacterium]